MTETQPTLSLDDLRMYDCCAHVTKGGKRCGALRWYHDDPGRARHRFVEPKSGRTDTEKVQILAAALRDELTALTIWQHAIHPRSDIQEGLAISITKIKTALKEVDQNAE